MTFNNSIRISLCLGVAVASTVVEAQTFKHDSASSSLRPPTGERSASSEAYVGGASDLEGGSTTSAVAASAVSAQETKFVKEAFAGNLHEVTMAEVAERKTQNEELKQFAKQLREDHAAANERLRTIAQSVGVETSPADTKSALALNKFNDLAGAEFDKEFSEMALQDHHKDIKKYEAANRFVQSPELREYISATLPKLRQHLQHGIQVAQAVGVQDSAIAQYRDALESSADSVGGSTLDSTSPDSGEAHSEINKTSKGAGAKELKHKHDQE